MNHKDKSTQATELQKYALPHWVRWLAQDADGIWWGYEVEPLERDTGWYENEVGRNIRLIKTEPNNKWRETLLRVN